MDRRRAAVAGIWLATLIVSFALYRSEHALEHFVWHLAYGGSLGLLLGAAWMLHRGRPSTPLGLWAWGGYVYMIVPDLIWIWPRFRGGSVHPHEPWMDVFLGHVFLDTWTWTNHLLVPTLVTAVALAWWAHRRASRDEPVQAAG